MNTAQSVTVIAAIAIVFTGASMALVAWARRW